MKYALFQVFCIPTEEMIDPDTESPELSDWTINATLEQALKDAIIKASIPNEEVIKTLAKFNCTKILELKYSQVQDFRKALGVDKWLELKNKR